MRFALLSTVPSVTLAQLQALAAAAEPELARVAAAWSVVDPSIVPPTVRVVSAVSELTDEDTPILLVPELPPEDARDVAFHSVQAGSNGAPRPYAVVLAEPGMAWDDISQAADHELKEATADRDCDKYDAITATAFQQMAGLTVDPSSVATVPGPNGVRVAREISDPVQGRRVVRNGVVLSAWVTPKWAGYGGDGPCVIADDGPDLAPGEHDPDGYVMHEDGHEDPPGYRPPSHKDHRFARRARRQRAWELRRTLPTGAPMVRP